jgi:hypothetical protein
MCARGLGADADFVGPTAASNTLPACAETLRYTPNDKLMKAPTKPPMKKNIIASRMKLMIAIPAMVTVADLGINAPPLQTLKQQLAFHGAETAGPQCRVRRAAVRLRGVGRGVCCFGAALPIRLRTASRTLACPCFCMLAFRASIDVDDGRRRFAFPRKLT